VAPDLNLVYEIHISKLDSFEHKFELACFRITRYTPAMSEQLESALPVGTFRPLVSARPIEAIERRPEPSLAKAKAKHSVVAVAFLALYVAVYLAIGLAGISLIGRAWAIVFE
jgi:hypothetical protein